MIRKFFCLLAAAVLTAGTTACNDEPKETEKQEVAQTHYLVYHVIVPKDVLKVADVKVSAFDPATGKTQETTLNSESETMWGDPGYRLLDYNLSLLTLGMFDAGKYLVYYRLASGVEPQQNYRIKAEWTVDDAKVAALPDNVLYTAARPTLAWYVADEDNNIKTQSSIVLSGNTVSKDKMVQILQRSTSDEKTGKLEFTPSMKPAE